MPAASLHALLKGSIDYAGLFPPANLALEPALRNYAEYIRHEEAWMLGAFILPAAEFDAASRWLNAFDEEHSLPISALGPRTENADGFLDSLGGMQNAIDMFRSRFGDAASIEQLEMPLPSDMNAELLASARSALDHVRVRTFWEAPAKSAPQTVELIAEQNRSHPMQPFGFKLRTGGVTAEAFPSPEAVAAALFATIRNGVPIKFTAGLHHPVRLFHESVQTKMHGFLNVLGAGVLASAHSWSEQQIVKMLEDEDPAGFRFSDEKFGWRDWEIPTDAIAAARQLVTSLGSCSFDEPREDLTALKLLGAFTAQPAPL